MMLQPHGTEAASGAAGHGSQAVEHAAQAVDHAAAGHGEGAAEGFNAGATIIEHVSNSSTDHPLIHLPHVFGIDMSVTKHVFMLWLVAAVSFVFITWLVRRQAGKADGMPTGGFGALEYLVEFVRDSIVLPNIGRKRVAMWTPLLLTLFVFIFCANAIGLIPIFDVLALLNHYVIHPEQGSFLASVVHGGTTATANYNVTAALATITFFAIIIAGTQAHGFINHWKNLVPHGLAWPVYIILIPIEIMGMFVKPFALTMRLAANMTGGHIAILAILSFVFLFAEMFGQAVAGIGVGLAVSVPLSVGISALEIIVVAVQAYVFTLLTAVFIGMAIHVHH
jgi:F-type H+-transporting ATPase subunit a